MNKVLVTGLAIGNETSVCNVCNYDCAWLVANPSILVWADRIVVPKHIWEIVKNEAWPQPKELAKCFRLVLEIAQSKGICEVFDPSPILTQDFRRTLERQVTADIEMFLDRFPKRARSQSLSKSKKDDGPTELILDDAYHYCIPRIWTIYASLILARLWKANCLFENDVLHYFKYKFGSTDSVAKNHQNPLQSFQTIFQAILPNEPLFPEYAYADRKRCSECSNDQSCKDTYLHVLEERISRFLEWRTYDEIHQIKEVIGTIISRRDLWGKSTCPDDILKDFSAQEARLRKRVRSAFPKLKRWSNVVTMVSVPLAVSGLAANISPFTVGGAIATGGAKLVEEGVKFLESKYRWVSFLSEIKMNSGQPKN